MRKLYSARTYVVEKYYTGSTGTHYANATDEVYLDNCTSRPDDEIYALYGELETIYSDDWKCFDLRRRLFIAEHSIKVRNVTESVSCYGETVRVKIIEDAQYDEIYINKLRTDLANKARTEETRARIIDNNTVNVIKPADGPARNARNLNQSGDMTLPLIKRSFPTLLGSSMISTIASNGVAKANRYIRRHRKRGK